MDSCNSGSMSSSGGDDEYDSRAESSFSAFLNHTHNNTLAHVGPMPNPPPQPPPPNHHQHSMFDPLSNYFDPSSSSSSRPSPLSNANPLLNLDMVWSKNLRSDPNCTNLAGFVAASSSPTQPFFTNQTQNRPSFNPPTQIPHGQESANATRLEPGLGAAGGSNDHQPRNNNPKKRSRASRRAPTTVLTTDTTNFRAMVQEFTGIPAPPFTSSPFPRTRLDIFGNSSSAFRSSTPTDSPQLPSYLLRPFAQKIQPPFLPTATTAATTTTTAITGSTSELGFLKYPQNLLNMQNNPILNLHSLLQPTTKYPLQDSSQHQQLDIPSNDSQLKMGLMEEFGLSHGHVPGLHNIVSSSDTALRRNDQSNWVSDGGVGSNEGELLRSINGGNYVHNSNSNTHGVGNNGKLNYTAASSSSEFRHGDKGAAETNLVGNNSRSEGMVESWICSSD
ncbi:uncharacterized protein LOC126657576 [Mercurialis annua]|uniref:uncharacterized protein LOC126657576 n=1 Tax=Mercurialis annua TaxID=3986 RepID=UPI00216098F3|nr:uncharacterized protein LOC126657576 [Mercurialis annua]